MRDESFQHSVSPAISQICSIVNQKKNRPNQRFGYLVDETLTSPKRTIHTESLWSIGELMNINIILSQLILVISFFYLLRGLVNWILLNQVERTNHPKIFNARPKDLILALRHLIISCLKPWWRGDEYRTMKMISNFFSVLLYLSILAFASIFIIHYKL